MPGGDHGILRVDNCSEIDVAGNLYKQDGKYYCCDSENEDTPECVASVVVIVIGCILSVIIGVLLLGIIVKAWLAPIFRRFWDYAWDKCNNRCCGCCEPQPSVRDDNNSTRNRTERSIAKDVRVA